MSETENGFEFRYRYDTQECVVKRHEDSDLDEVAEAFESFLKAAGFSPKIKVVIERD